MVRKSLCLLLSVAGLGMAVLAVGANADAERIIRLVSQLGSGRFAERDAASKELDAIGEAALPALKQAVKSGDAETRRRAEELIDRIERRGDTQRLLAAAKVRLVCKDTLVREAVADLAKQSGRNVVLDPASARRLADRKVTLDTGATTFWAALDELCRDAKLREAHDEEMDLTTLKLSSRLGDRPPTAHRIILHDGAPEALPTHRAGAVRIRALPRGVDALGVARKEGEILFALGVALAGRTSLEQVTGVRLDRAVDDQDQNLTLIARTEPEPAEGGMTILPNTGKGPPRVLVPVGDRRLAVRLQVGAKSARSLKEFSGVVLAKVRTPAEPRLTVNDILKASSKTIEGKDGLSLTVQGTERDADGSITVRVDLTQTVAGQGVAPELIKFKVQRLVVVGGGALMQVGDDVPSLRLVDSQGKAFPAPEIQNNRFTLSDGSVTQALTLIYRPGREQSAAARLEYLAPGREGIEIPFTLKEVPLP